MKNVRKVKYFKETFKSPELGRNLGENWEKIGKLGIKLGNAIPTHF